MRIRLLGTAAGGGFPQWNCWCDICAVARHGFARALPRTQSGVAISADDERWFLLNASPDIRLQIESFKPLRPSTASVRNTPIEAVLLTNADLDHTLGLLLLREGGTLLVHASAQVRHTLTAGFRILPLLEKFCGIEWVRMTEKQAPLLCRNGAASGLSYSAFPVPGKPPRYMHGEPASPGDSVGLKIVDERTGGTLVFVPDIAAVDDFTKTQLTGADVLLFDGTFWSETEMRDRLVGQNVASEMGHIPISGEHGSLKILARLPAARKVYVHINNTNPILLEDSPERGAVVAAGIDVGRDGEEYMI